MSLLRGHRIARSLVVVACGLAVVAGLTGAGSAVAATHKMPLNATDRVSVSGTTLVWSDITEHDGWDVFVRDEITGRVKAVGGPGDQLAADVDGDIVVFTDYRGGEADIRGYDISADRLFDICVKEGTQSNPVISGDWAVWSQLGLGSTGAITALNVHTGEQVLVAGSAGANAQIADEKVIFEDHSGGVVAAKLFDLSTGSITSFADGRSDQLMPTIDAERAALVVSGPEGVDVAYVSLAQAGEAPTLVEREGEQSSPSLSNDTLTFLERVPGKPIALVSMSLANGHVDITADDGDIVAYAMDGSAVAAVRRSGADAWILESEIPAASLRERLGAYLTRAWRRAKPASYAVWSENGATIDSEVTPAAAMKRPEMMGARVTTEGVALSWKSPRSVAGIKGFDVYRSAMPIDKKSLSLATKVATVKKMDYTDKIDVSAETTAKASSYHYAVVAIDQRNDRSEVSNSVSANPHGLSAYGAGCAECHVLHARSGESTSGALGALSAQRCYECHGSTTDTAATGAGALADVEASFGDETLNTVGPERLDGGSVHRNAEMVKQQRECAACHESHARGFVVDAQGKQDKAKSAPGLLKKLDIDVDAKGKRQTAKLSIAALSADKTSGSAFCLGCHGASMTPIAGVGGAAAYSNTAGDHSGNGRLAYDESAHGPSAVAADEGAPQCLVCHNQHASATARLIDYRQSGTTDPVANKQANLCFKCHNATTANTWNGRNVVTEFSRTSTHPVAASDGEPSSATCVSCHNSHFVAKGTGAWDTDRVANPQNLTQGVTSATAFCLKCHSGSKADGSITIAAQVGSSQLVPYTVKLRPALAGAFSSGWDKAATGTEFTKSGHATASITEGRAGCETCHDPHGSDFGSLIAWTRPAGAKITGGLTGVRANTAAFADRSQEENLCLQCHGNGESGTGDAAGAQDVATAMASGNAHPVDKTGQHSASESQADLDSTRHAECVDCHNPHAARAGVHKPDSSAAGEALRGATGVEPTWVAANWGGVSDRQQVTVIPGGDNGYEAYVCFKCHSGAANSEAASSAGFSTDVAREFNPANLSAHRVLGELQPGVKTSFTIKPVGSASTMNISWSFPSSNVFAPGQGADSMVTCTSCHSGQAGAARGPHGSSSKYLLDSRYSVDWNSTEARLSNDSASGMTPGLICGKCHDLTNGGWGNNVHARHAEAGGQYAQCRNCHTGVVHGWSRPRMLGYTTDAAPYGTFRNASGTSSSGDWGLTRVRAKENTSPDSWKATDCYAGCHAVHSTSVQTYWP